MEGNGDIGLNLHSTKYFIYSLFHGWAGPHLVFTVNYFFSAQFKFRDDVSVQQSD